MSMTSRLGGVPLVDLLPILAPLAAAWLEPLAPHPRYHVTMAMLALLAVATNVTAVLRARYVLKRLPRRA